MTTQKLKIKRALNQYIHGAISRAEYMRIRKELKKN